MPDELVVNETAEQPAAEQEAPQVQEPSAKPEQEEQKPQMTKAEKDAARLARTVQSLQAELKQLKSKAEAPAQSSDENQALSGLEKDEDGNVILDGEALPAKLAQRILNLEAKLGETRSSMTEKQLSEIDAKIQQANEQFQAAVIHDIVSARESAFPDIPKEQTQAIDKIMLAIADSQIGQQAAAGKDITSIDYDELTQSVLSEFKSAFGALASAQAADNANYKEQDKIRNNGLGGIPAQVPESELSRADKQRIIAERARRAREAALRE